MLFFKRKEKKKIVRKKLKDSTRIVYVFFYNIIHGFFEPIFNGRKASRTAK